MMPTEGVRTMEQLFTSTPLVSMLSSLTVWKIPQLLQAWQDKINKNNRIQQIVIGFKQDTTKSMAQRLETLGLSYAYLAEQYDMAKSPENFVKWLKSVGVKYKAWHEKIVLILKSVRSKYVLYAWEVKATIKLLFVSKGSSTWLLKIWIE